MEQILLAWIGNTDLRSAAGAEDAGIGPVAQAVDAREFDRILLLSDHEASASGRFLAWLEHRAKAPVEVLHAPLSGPTRFGEIYRACEAALRQAPAAALTFHLSPGTPAMAAVWIILSKTRFPAELIESSRQHGVRTASVPFDISAEFIPDLLRGTDARLRAASAERPPEAPEFDDIVHRSRVMARLVDRARRVAPRSVPVLIEGESGTGKELFARAIHRASPRRDGPFVAVNCGAIPADLVESELFGHEKGAFTGAATARKGRFEAAGGGTLFLDEIGDLPAAAQVKLLRVLQEGEVTRLGAQRPVCVDARIVAATNRTLLDEVAEGRFREDLFYRVAVAVLKVPPLRERPGDVGLLVDHLLAQVNAESRAEPGFVEKRLSVGARNLLLGHSWSGNVRELLNTLRRAAIWSADAAITAEDVRDALLPACGRARSEVLGRPLGGGFSLPRLVLDVERHYLERAMDETHANKTKAAALLGLASYQTLTNWLKRHGLAR